jgi:hypothetical protein
MSKFETVPKIPQPFVGVFLPASEKPFAEPANFQNQIADKRHDVNRPLVEGCFCQRGNRMNFSI